MQIREPFPIKGVSQCFYVTSHDEEVLRVLVGSYQLKIHICQISGMKLKQIGLLETNFYIDHTCLLLFCFSPVFFGFNQTWFQPNHGTKGGKQTLLPTHHCWVWRLPGMGRAEMCILPPGSWMGGMVYTDHIGSHGRDGIFDLHEWLTLYGKCIGKYTIHGSDTASHWWDCQAWDIYGIFSMKPLVKPPFLINTIYELYSPSKINMSPPKEYLFQRTLIIFQPLIFRWNVSFRGSAVPSLQLSRRLKMDGWKTTFLFGAWPIFRGENVNFRRGISSEFSLILDLPKRSSNIPSL